jgi:hypothetical protein
MLRKRSVAFEGSRAIAWQVTRPVHPWPGRVGLWLAVALAACGGGGADAVAEINGAARDGGSMQQAGSAGAGPGAGASGGTITPVDAGQADDDAATALDAGPDAAADEDSGVAIDAGGAATARMIGAPPTYLGASGADLFCLRSFRTIGYAPEEDGQRHPLFLYFVGTEFVSADQSSKYDSQAALKVTEAMARRGFVALSVEYDNSLTAFLTNKLECLFSEDQRDSVISKACSLSNVDCARGIATWGHSQGALLAHVAANMDSRVKAVWTTGYSGIDNPRLAYNRLRVVNGEADTTNADLDTITRAAGLTTAECPDDGRDRCLRADGSGWILVRKSQCRVTSADHCWFDKRSCSENAETLEPNWLEPASSAAFALESNADWVADTVARP